MKSIKAKIIFLSGNETAEILVKWLKEVLLCRERTVNIENFLERNNNLKDLLPDDFKESFSSSLDKVEIFHPDPNVREEARMINLNIYNAIY